MTNTILVLWLATFETLHWLQFRQLRTWIHDNLCYLTIRSDTGQHSQFLRCLIYFLRMLSILWFCWESQQCVIIFRYILLLSVHVLLVSLTTMSSNVFMFSLFCSLQDRSIKSQLDPNVFLSKNKTPDGKYLEMTSFFCGDGVFCLWCRHMGDLITEWLLCFISEWFYLWVITL